MDCGTTGTAKARLPQRPPRRHGLIVLVPSNRRFEMDYEEPRGSQRRAYLASQTRLMSIQPVERPRTSDHGTTLLFDLAEFPVTECHQDDDSERHVVVLRMKEEHVCPAC